jgi:hypothetical protein
MKDHSLRRQRGLALIAGVIVAAAVQAAANADSLVVTKKNEVWISHTDGSAARPVTASPNNWAWPSMDDDGTIFAAGGKQRVNSDGSDSDGSAEIYHFSQVWLDNSDFMITHNGPTFGNAAFAVYELANPGASHGPGDLSFLPEYRAVARATAARWLSTRRIRSSPEVSRAPTSSCSRRPAGTSTPGPMKCKITINAANAADFVDASPSFTPNGSELTWAEKDGIHAASTADLNNCGSATDCWFVVARSRSSRAATKSTTRSP